MICAYNRVYLDKVRTTLSRMLDFAVYNIAEIFDLFIKSSVVKCFEIRRIRCIRRRNQRQILNFCGKNPV